MRSYRTTAISILRLTLLYKRFGASAEYRYELSIQAVMYSVIEAHLAVFCAILPRLGYKMFFARIAENRRRRVSGPDLRELTLGFTPPAQDGESLPLNDMANCDARKNDTAYGLYRNRQYNNRPHNDSAYNDGLYGYGPHKDRCQEIAELSPTPLARTVE